MQDTYINDSGQFRHTAWKKAKKYGWIDENEWAIS